MVRSVTSKKYLVKYEYNEQTAQDSSLKKVLDSLLAILYEIS